jgi:uncharacterized BrkB/YihY/UPF0761 family membrane protein
LSFQFSLVLGLGFGILAAMVALVIFFEAYRRQQFDRGRIWRESLTAAVFAFAVFLVASIALGYLLKEII